MSVVVVLVVVMVQLQLRLHCRFAADSLLVAAVIEVEAAAPAVVVVVFALADTGPFAHLAEPALVCAERVELELSRAFDPRCQRGRICRGQRQQVELRHAGWAGSARALLVEQQPQAFLENPAAAVGDRRARQGLDREELLSPLRSLLHVQYAAPT